MSDRFRTWLRDLMPGPVRERYHRYALRRDFGIGERDSGPERRAAGAGLAPGLNVIGYFDSVSGVGQSARAMAAAAEAAGVPVLRIEAAAGGDRRVSSPYDVNLYHVNADGAGSVVETLGPRLHAGRRNVAYWYWESDRFPARWADRFRYFDEIWVASEFCRRAIASVSPIPVHRIPPAVLASEAPRDGAGRSGDAFRFLCVFDAFSVPERKNPIGTIRAFARAFPRSSGAALRVQAHNGRRVEGLLGEMRAAAEGANVVIEDRALTPPELGALFSSCDAYLSLHRCEGFGFPIAEAMALGKPVIATDYSGSTDFLDERTGFPVRWKPWTLAWPLKDYEVGTVWADPEEAHAVETMRLVSSQPAERTRRAEAGRRRILELYAPRASGGRIAARLEALRAPGGAAR
ncbi:MAG: glycosyltransferase family 4 protein [Thermoanaerobaculia bacterium]